MHQGFCHKRRHGFGCRMTIPRRIISETFMAHPAEHFSAEELFLKIKEIEPGIGIATVYRTLDLLLHSGIIAKIEIGDGKSRYQLAQGPGAVHHHHLICSVCGRIIDYSLFLEEEKQFLTQVEKALSKKFNFQIIDHQLNFYGLCENCKERR